MAMPPTALCAGPGQLTERARVEVMKIARAIGAVNPRISEGQKVEFGFGIFRASERYGIAPAVLIAIAQQESGFRPNLPEGRAGEIGLCQILKSWLRNPKFVSEFGVWTEAQLKNPAKSFMAAAWLLNDLKLSIASKTLPYWSYYNAMRFENRFKYFLLVNRNIATLRKHAITRQAQGEDTTGIWVPPQGTARFESRRPGELPVRAVQPIESGTLADNGPASAGTLAD